MSFQIRTFTGIPRSIVTAILINAQRAIILDEGDDTAVGDLVRIVSDEPNPAERLCVTRVVTHRSTARVISLRPLTEDEKEALK